MNIVTLAGGVGGAKLAQGLALTPALTPSPSPKLGEGGLTIIVNTGDDFEWHGLYVCPDLDTVTYTLGGLANTVTGWGVAGDTFETLDALKRLGAEAWFNIGDRDLATHVYRTALLQQGKTLTEATQLMTRALGIEATILPMTDDRFRTLVETDQDVLEFQEYFVRRQWQPIVKRIIFDGEATARATPQVIEALHQADAIIIAPSNPFVSVGPILALTPTPALLRQDGGGSKGGGRPIAAVSPIVGGQAIKGPAAKMFRELGWEPSALAVARHYQGLVTHFVLDQLDAAQESAIQSLGMQTLVTNTIMQSVEDRARLASEVVEFVTREA
ncbi:MAG TPA: 2-phospho-L-lactate transferase [Anaerolineae bacterium]|nr:2-phospho-L-lactate transferase [Anaerolineae bacterium]